MEKKRLVISYNNLSGELMEQLKKKYPHGYTDHVIKVNTSNDKYFYAVTLDTPDASYLVKVDVKIDTNTDDLDEKSYSEEDDVTTDDDTFGTGEEDFDNIPDSDD